MWADTDTDPSVDILTNAETESGQATVLGPIGGRYLSLWLCGWLDLVSHGLQIILIYFHLEIPPLVTVTTSYNIANIKMDLKVYISR